VAEIHNLLPRTGLHIVGEYFQKIHYQLLAPKAGDFGNGEDGLFASARLDAMQREYKKLKLDPIPHSNTAAAASDVAKWNDPTKAALHQHCRRAIWT